MFGKRLAVTAGLPFLLIGLPLLETGVEAGLELCLAAHLLPQTLPEPPSLKDDQTFALHSAR